VPRALEELVLEALRVDEGARPSAEILAERMAAVAERLAHIELARVVKRACSDAWAEEEAFARRRSGRIPLSRSRRRIAPHRTASGRSRPDSV